MSKCSDYSEEALIRAATERGLLVPKVLPGGGVPLHIYQQDYALPSFENAELIPREISDEQILNALRVHGWS